MIHGVAAQTRWLDLREALTLSANVQAFAVSGQPATLTYRERLAGEAGNFILSGQVADFIFYKISAASGSFTISGQSTVADAFASSNVLLISFAGADGDTTAVDAATGKTITFAGNSQIDTAQSKFGASSLLLDGTGDWLTLADSNDFSFGSGTFTVECWVRFNVVGDAAFFSKWTGLTTTAEWQFNRTSTSGLGFSFIDTGNTQRTVSSAWTPSTGQWYHLAADRDSSNVLRIYVDGAMLAKDTLSQTIANRAEGLRIGSRNASPAQSLNGWIDYVRITKGVARYASDSGFSVQAQDFI